jgi:WD40 repeat protein
MFGHSADQDIESYSPIYNAVFDRSENLILTSGEEGLIKVWHRGSGTLIKNLKGILFLYLGHTDFLNKIETSKCNKYLLSCGGDGIRFFDLKTLKPLGGWRTNAIDEITSFID